MQFCGAMTAIVTPFRDGRVDEPSLRALIDWQIAGGIDGIVACGSTGEAMTLSDDERDRVVRIAVEQTAGRAIVVAGAGSNSTAQAVANARSVKKAGADVMLQVTPYYNKPPQEGLYQHFRTIAQMVDLPMFLYNVPGRTAVNLLPETVVRLSSVDNVIGIKESSGDTKQVKKIIDTTPKDFVVLSGEDDLNLEIYRLGGKGCISVTGNIVPKKTSSVWDDFSSGNVDRATKTQEELTSLNKVMFIETNPIPVKTALTLMKKIHEEFRLPLVPISETALAQLEKTLKEHKVI